MKTRSTLLYVVSFLCFGPVAWAAFSGDPEYIIKSWEVEQGLPENSATSIVQTPDGYLWIGTFNGLVRFDGIKFTIFDRLNTPSLPSPGIVNLFLDKSGGLWVSTLLGPVYVKDGKWYTFGPASGWAGDYVRTFAQSRSGEIYMLTFDGKLERYSNGHFEQLPPLPVNAAMISGPDIGIILYVNEDGDVCVATATFAGKLVDGVWKEVIPSATLRSSTKSVAAGNSYLMGASSRDGGLWIATDWGLRKYRAGKLVLEAHAPWPLQHLWYLSEDSTGNVWISSDRSGLYRYAPEGRWFHLTMENGLSYNTIRFTFEDREGNIWVGTSGGGLMRFSRRHFRVVGMEDGLPNRIVKSITTDREGAIVIATHGEGVFRRENERITPVLLPGAGNLDAAGRNSCGTFGGLSFSTTVDHKGRVWIGTYSDGLYMVDHGKCRSFFASKGRSSEVHSLFVDSQGSVWVGTENAAIRFEDERYQRYPLEKAPALSSITSFAEDPRSGTIWAANLAGGVYRLSGDHFVPVDGAEALMSQQLSTLLADPDGTLWIGTADGGMACFRNGRLITIAAKQGLPVRSIASIVDDELGNLWMGSNRGVLRVARNDLEALIAGRRPQASFQLFNMSDGLTSLEFQTASQPTATKDLQGNLWFATWTGAVVVNPKKLFRSTAVPPLIIENTLLDGQPLGDPQQVITSRVANPVSVEVPPGGHRLEIQYASLSFAAPEKVRFRYRLEGLDEDWIDVGDRRSIYFQNMRPGRYTLRLMATDANGVWHEMSPATELIAHPHFYETYWFYGCSSLGVFLVAIGIYWLKVRSLRMRQAELESCVTERTSQLQQRSEELQQRSQELEREVCEHQRAEDSLSRSKEEFRSLVENAPCGIFRCSARSDKFLWVNAALVSMLGYSGVEDLLHLRLSRDLYCSPSDCVMPWEFANTPETFEKEVEWRRKDASRVKVKLVGRAVESNDSGDIVLQVIAQDETDRSALEAQLRQSQKMDAVGRLAGGIAHDFNNLLGVIVGNGELLLDQLDKADPNRKRIEHITHAAERGSALTQQLLAYGRKQVMQTEAVALNALLANMGELLRRVIGEDVNLGLQFPADLGIINADRSHIEQVLLNLVINARDAMPNGGSLTVEARNVSLDEAYCRHNPGANMGDYVSLRVIDTGCGMSQETLSHIFEPFFTTKPVGKGTGMGLSTVYGIVKQSGGFIKVDSELGKGTCIEVLLPRIASSSPHEDGSGSLFGQTRGTETVLVVEDQQDLLQVMVETLEHLGYKVLNACGGQDALQIAQQHQGDIHLLVTDVVMPGMSGRELSEKIVHLRPSTHILFISGYTDGVIAQHGVLEPGTFFLQKPFKPAELGMKVREVIHAAAIPHG